MSRLRSVGLSAVVLGLAFGGAACSKDDPEPTTSDRGAVSFADPPVESTAVGICEAYTLDEMKGILGGDEYFKQLAPTAIGAEGDAVTGQACAWERNDPNGDQASIRIEVRDFGEDLTGVTAQFGELEQNTIGAEPVEGLGDDAFASEADEAMLLQVLDGAYVVTLASRGTGDLEPADLATLTALATAGMEELS